MYSICQPVSYTITGVHTKKYLLQDYMGVQKQNLVVLKPALRWMG